eukprot:gene6302-528_t
MLEAKQALAAGCLTRKEPLPSHQGVRELDDDPGQTCGFDPSSNGTQHQGLLQVQWIA